ncbi:MAG: repeat protein [Acidobacteriaceae bacterium]|nr:repeat protein [Acidobacteriaceae bacterium]
MILVAGGLVAPALADVIHLKNGDVIHADEVKEIGNRIEYQKGDDSYTIPKSVVQSVEKTGAPQIAASVGNQVIPTYTPASHAIGEDQLLEQVLHSGKVDREWLREIDSRGNRPKTAIAFYVAAKQEFESEDYGSSQRDFETALRNDPQNPAILNFYAALLIKIGNARHALFYAERAVEQAPDSPDAYAVLGYAQYSAEHARDAIQSWRKSIALRPDTSIRQMIARAERETHVESNYTERETGHFVLHYEGAQSSEIFRAQILTTLESAYRDLAQVFGSEPRSSIPVVLYTSQTFFDVTRAPGWMGALNDGKIRLPLRGMNSVTPGLARILRHELTHSFVEQVTLGRCPQWLNEGMAQMLEPRSLNRGGAFMAQMFKTEREIPLNSIEGGFSNLSGAQADVVYMESLATVSYIRDRYGMSDVLRILEKLGQGESIESALRSTIHCDYRQLQEETGVALIRQFGS